MCGYKIYHLQAGAFPAPLAPRHCKSWIKLLYRFLNYRLHFTKSFLPIFYKLLSRRIETDFLSLPALNNVCTIVTDVTNFHNFTLNNPLPTASTNLAFIHW